MTYGHDTLFKALDGTISPVAWYRYPIGRWTRHLDPSILEPCRTGYHLVRGPRVLKYLESALYTAEACPEHGVLEAEGQLLTCQVRLSQRIATWNRRTARLFAADCAEAVLLSESACGREPEKQLWATVETARRFANALADDDELKAAEEAAWGINTPAGWAAVRSADAYPWDAAWYANRSAVEAAGAEALLGADARVARSAAESTMFDRLLLYLNERPLPPVEPLYGPRR